MGYCHKHGCMELSRVTACKGKPLLPRPDNNELFRKDIMILNCQLRVLMIYLTNLLTMVHESLNSFICDFWCWRIGHHDYWQRRSEKIVSYRFVAHFRNIA